MRVASMNRITPLVDTTGSRGIQRGWTVAASAQGLEFSMASSDVERLRDALVSQRLVAAGDFDDCTRAVGEDDVQTLIKQLERRQLLTSYQSGLITKGDFESLTLGDYKLLYRNASGSFARVFRATNLTDGVQVGIKLLRQRWSDDPKMVSQFRREALMLKRFKHDNIVPIYDVFSDGDRHYFTMEFVEGGNLRELINIRKKMTPEDATKCILDLTRGLDYALNMGATHRDLKMTNVLMSATGTAKLIDFGLAGDSVSGGPAGDDVQRALEYATLEKGTNAPQNDPRSDLFFLGAIYYELLTGQPPYPRTRDREERKQFSRYANVTPISEYDVELPKCVTDIVERLMKVEPRERFQRPSELVPHLMQALSVLQGGNSGPGGNGEPDQYSIMFVEERTKQQGVLKDYLGRHGFRVLVSANPDRAVNRISTPNAPHCVVFMGDTVGDDLHEVYRRASREARGTGCRVLAVMPSKSSDNVDGWEESETAKVLRPPLTLRRLRVAICDLLGLEADSSTAG